jgi:transcriptional regulator with XRE-family HTH domain
MTESSRNIYKVCREQAGYTHERAAELLPCSVRALSRYESGFFILLSGRN